MMQKLTNFGFNIGFNGSQKVDLVEQAQRSEGLQASLLTVRDSLTLSNRAQVGLQEAFILAEKFF